MSPSDTKTTEKTLSVLNPFDLSPVDTLAENDETDVEDALATAYGLFRDRELWLPAHARLAVL